jgi:putative sterol carrier protein
MARRIERRTGGRTATRQSTRRVEPVNPFEGIPVLSEFATPLPNLLRKRPAAIGESFRQIAKALAKSKRKGSIQFTLREGVKTRRWSLTMTASGCTVAERATRRPDLEILADAKSWTDVATGALAPLEAFGLGKLRVRGRIELARLIARRLRR